MILGLVICVLVTWRASGDEPEPDYYEVCLEGESDCKHGEYVSGTDSFSMLIQAKSVKGKHTLEDDEIEIKSEVEGIMSDALLQAQELDKVTSQSASDKPPAELAERVFDIEGLPNQSKLENLQGNASYANRSQDSEAPNNWSMGFWLHSAVAAARDATAALLLNSGVLAAFGFVDGSAVGDNIGDGPLFHNVSEPVLLQSGLLLRLQHSVNVKGAGGAVGIVLILVFLMAIVAIGLKALLNTHDEEDYKELPGRHGRRAQAQSHLRNSARDSRDVSMPGPPTFAPTSKSLQSADYLTAPGKMSEPQSLAQLQTPGRLDQSRVQAPTGRTDTRQNQQFQQLHQQVHQQLHQEFQQQLQQQAALSSPAPQKSYLCDDLVVPQHSECLLLIPRYPPPSRERFDVLDTTGTVVLQVTKRGSGPPASAQALDAGVCRLLLTSAQGGDSLAQCCQVRTTSVPGSCEVTQFQVLTGAGDYFGGLSRTAQSDQYEFVLSVADGQKLIFRGDKEQYSWRVTDADGKMVANTEMCHVTFEVAPVAGARGGYFRLRLAQQTDVGAILCGLLCIHQLSGDPSFAT